METSDTIKELLSDILKKTVEKKIIWTVVNPNVIRWTKQGPPQSIVTLQKQPSTNPNIKENYVLTIQNNSLPAKSIIQISSTNEQSLKELLFAVFSEALKEHARRNEEKRIESLKNLLIGL